MAITLGATAINAFNSTGDSTPSTKYNRSLSVGTTVILAYGAINTAGSSHTLSSVSDSAGNSYTRYVYAGASGRGAVGLAVCRLTAAVTTATTITFTLSTSHDCKFAGYYVTGAVGTANASANDSDTVSITTPATISLAATKSPSVLFAAVNYHRDFGFSVDPSTSNATLISFNDTGSPNMSLGFVYKQVTDTSATTFGMTSTTKYPYTIQAIAIGEYIATASGSQVIEMF